MKIFFAAALLLLLTACGSGDKTEKAVTNDTTEQQGDSAVITAVRLTAGQVPSQLKFAGTLYEAWQWKDKLGDNLLLTAIVAPYSDKQKNESGEEGRSAALHAFHYVKKDTAYVLRWKMSDAEKSCPFDINVDFIKGATIITDLDNDGIAESTVQYKLACRSDVSPAYMKLIMHEDSVKHSLRGVMWVKAGEEEFAVTENDMNLEKIPLKTDEYEQMMQRSGRYESEKEFAGAPPAFLQHARKQWMKYVKEVFEETAE